MSMPGGMEWVLIVLVILLLFGTKKVPEFMKGLGQGIKEFKKASTEPDKEKVNADKAANTAVGPDTKEAASKEQ